MADYLFRAPDVDMARWKAEADQRGRSFAEHIRACLDLVNRCPTSLLDQLLGPTRPPYESAPEVSPVEPALVAERLGPDGAGAASTGRQVRPDPK